MGVVVDRHTFYGPVRATRAPPAYTEAQLAQAVAEEELSAVQAAMDTVACEVQDIRKGGWVEQGRGRTHICTHFTYCHTI